MVERWGTLPLTMLRLCLLSTTSMPTLAMKTSPCIRYCSPDHSCRSMNRERRVVERQWRSDYDRPIYLVETRDGFTCCWCDVLPNMLVLRPHSLSPAQVRILKHPQEAEVIGQVVGVAMRIGSLVAAESQEPTEFSESKQSVILSSSGSLKAMTGADLPSISTRKKLG